MCGIAGIVSQNRQQVSMQRLTLMTDAIAHRGPDGEAFWINEKNQVGFGHRRLAIIDLSEGGKQPMHLAGRFTIIFNGEIYNYLELRKTLATKGCVFQSESDTEVILAAYSIYKEDCLQHFDGMFSFAIWDEEEQSLFAARDRFGEKPFYYYYDPVLQTLIFASEMKALWAAGIAREMNHRMMLGYLSLGFVQNPADQSETFFKSIYALPPASMLTLGSDAMGPQVSKYYLPVIKEDPNQQIAITSEKFLQLFSESVSRRLRSDVAIGTSLSGGLDSSSVVAMIDQLNAGKVASFSAVFPGFEKDESQYIRRMVQENELVNYQVEPSADELLKDFARLCHYQEEPFPSSSIYTQYRVYKLAKEHGVTVLLDGQGADEVLAGYPKYMHWFLQELISTGRKGEALSELNFIRQNQPGFSWSWKNRLAAKLPVSATRALVRKARRAVIQQPDLNSDYRQAYTDEARFTKPVIRTLEDILTYNRSQFGLEELLRFADRNSMAHGCEVRLPFLNHHLVEFVSSLPANMKFHSGYSKYLLRYCMEDKLPQEICWRKDKIGFEPPQKTWMEIKDIQDFIHEARKRLVREGILNGAVLQKKIQPHDAHAAENYDFKYMVAAAFL